MCVQGCLHPLTYTLTHRHTRTHTDIDTHTLLKHKHSGHNRRTSKGEELPYGRKQQLNPGYNNTGLPHAPPVQLPMVRAADVILKCYVSMCVHMCCVFLNVRRAVESWLHNTGLSHAPPVQLPMIRAC